MIISYSCLRLLPTDLMRLDILRSLSEYFEFIFTFVSEENCLKRIFSLIFL